MNGPHLSSLSSKGDGDIRKKLDILKALKAKCETEGDMRTRVQITGITDIAFSDLCCIQDPTICLGEPSTRTPVALTLHE